MGERTGEQSRCRGCGEPLLPRESGQPGRLKQFCDQDCWPRCSTEGCDGVATKIGLCETCYSREFRSREWGFCTVGDCSTRAVGPHGLCNAHNLKRYRNKPCVEEGCEKPAVGRGLCAMHYMRTQREKHGRRRHLARNFGITQADYDAIMEAQGGVCAVCGHPEHKAHPVSGKPFALPVDHNHQTKEVRGLLCSNCNAALGLLGDDVERVKAVIVYLENPPARAILGDSVPEG